MLQNYARNETGSKVILKFFQSNHEGALIDYIQKEADAFGLVINPGALSHYSIALFDALSDFKGKKVEVHLSDISKREIFRKVSITGTACDFVIAGEKERGYLEALKFLIDQKCVSPL
jgi:3-dehydroquinate dehydratase-2